MKHKLQIGDRVRVGVGPSYTGYEAEVIAVHEKTWPKPHHSYSVRWIIAGGVGTIDEVFCTDWRRITIS